MIRHIVMFKLKEFPDETAKMAVMLEVKQRIDELPLKINFIRRCETGVDMRKLQWSYDIVLVMDFDTVADVESYTIHPAHQDFVAFNKDYSVKKVCVDYEI